MELVANLILISSELILSDRTRFGSLMASVSYRRTIFSFDKQIQQLQFLEYSSKNMKLQQHTSAAISSAVAGSLSTCSRNFV